MVFKVSVVHHFVYKTGHVWHPSLIRFGVGAVECKVEMEVWIFLFQLVEVFQEERFAQTSRTIEVMHLAIASVKCFEHVHNLTAKGCHTSTATNPNHLFLRVEYRVEITKRTTHHHLIAWLAREDIAGCNTRGHILKAHLRARLKRCCGYTHG